MLPMLPLLLALAAYGETAPANLLVNGDFEAGMQGWAKVWSRKPGTEAQIDQKVRNVGTAAVRIEHPSDQDWSLSQDKSLTVHPGEIYELTGWLRAQGTGSVAFGVTLYDAKNNALDWGFGNREVRGTTDWRQVRSRFAIPPGGARILPRLSGHGPTTAWGDGLQLRRAGQVDLSVAATLPETIARDNRFLEATFRPAEGTLTLRDLRTGQTWSQLPGKRYHVLDARATDNGIEANLLDPLGPLQVRVRMELDADKPELSVELAAEGGLTRLNYPYPFASPAGSYLIMPVNEGIAYPADDKTLRPMHYYLYGGHGLCMAWYGVTDLKRGLMTLVETPDDAAVDVPRRDGMLHLAPEWEPQKGEFGYSRRLRYVLFDQGGYVAMAKRHRAHAKATGLLKTMAEKRRENPNVDLLIGAVNVWAFGMDGLKLCPEMQALGIRRILWSGGGGAQTIEKLNALPDVLTSRYDIYQDCMDPANFPQLRYKHGDWTSEGWPRDIMIDAAGDWIRGWRVEGKDDKSFHCGVLCDRVAPDYARRRIAEELKSKPYRCRFIDTTTASPWRECYAPDHPVTRSESKKFKMELLDVVSREFKLVTGCETGHEASVPYLHYYEGMLSLGPYRVADSGRRMADIVDEVPEQVSKFQTGHYYRLPLWELVYHDCTVAQWYWGDYNNKLPKVWDRRDLWNALYGTPPMFLFVRSGWEKNKERFVQSYRTATPVARATGYSEMLSHEWLSDDHAVQQTRFANGVTVTVNFGDQPFRLADGATLPAMSHRTNGLPPQ